MSESTLERAQLERLLEVGRTLVTELDLDTLLRRVVQEARDLTEARYAALGVLDSENSELERFIYVGIDEDARRRIGPLPRGHGVLGELIEDPAPLRLEEVGTHPRSYGFPAGHPEMKTFLGVPIKLRGQAWGNLYLTEKSGGRDFDERDEELAIVLAEWAAVAVGNARLHSDLERRQHELKRAVRTHETSAALARASASGMKQAPLARMIAKRGRDLVGARQTLVLLPRGGRLVVEAAGGEGIAGLESAEVDEDDPFIFEALRLRLPRSYAVGEGLELKSSGLGAGSSAALVAPLELRDGERGLLLAFDPIARSRFDRYDERRFESFAASATITLSTARAAEEEKLRLSMEASERERLRWAHELHDETLQDLAALQMLIDRLARNGTDADPHVPDLRQAGDHIARGIRNLRGLITELRPATLDDLGLAAAIEALVDHINQIAEFTVVAEVDIGDSEERLAPELELTAYRLVQEALNNVIKHARAEHVAIRIFDLDGVLTVRVSDDGVGFDPKNSEGGFGLVGMRERVSLAGGGFSIHSSPDGGTVVESDLPSHHRKDDAQQPGQLDPAPPESSLPRSTRLR